MISINFSYQLYVLTEAYIGNLIPFVVYIYNATFDIILCIIELGLFRLVLEIPVVLHKILNAITSKEFSSINEKDINNG